MDEFEATFGDVRVGDFIRDPLTVDGRLAEVLRTRPVAGAEEKVAVVVSIDGERTAVQRFRSTPTTILRTN